MSIKLDHLLIYIGNEERTINPFKKKAVDNVRLPWWLRQ